MFGMGGSSDMQVNIKGDASSLEAAAAQAVTSMSGVKKAAIGMSAAVGVAAAAGVGKSVTAFADFDAAMTESLAIMGDVSDTQRNEMSDAAREVAKTTQFSAEQAAESYFFLASAGMDAEQSIAAMPQVANFAQAGMMDMAKATDIATDAQSALGMAAEDPQENLENLTRVTDVLVGANTLANASVEEFGQAMMRSGAQARTAGYDVEETGAVLAVFADQGTKGQKAGTLLNATLRNLQDGAQKNSKAWEELGVSVYDAQGNMRPMADITADLEDATAGMTDEQKAATMSQLGFNRQGERGMLMLMGNSDAMREYEDELNEMGGITSEVSEKQLQTFHQQLGLLKSAVMDIAITIGGVLVPKLSKLLQRIVPMVEAFADWIDEGNETTAALGLVGTAIAGFIPLAAALAAQLGSLMGFGALIGIFKGIGGAILAMTGPVGLLIAAVGALAYAFATDYKGIRGITEEVAEDTFAELEPLIDLFDRDYPSAIDTLNDVWAEHGDTVGTVLITAYARAIRTIPPAVGAMVSAIMWSVNRLEDFWLAHGQTIKSAVTDAYGAIMNAARDFSGTFQTIVTEATEAASEAFEIGGLLWAGDVEGAFGAIVDAARAFGARLGEAIEVALGLALEAFIEFANEVIFESIIPEMFDAIVAYATDAMDALFDAIADGLDRIITLFTDIFDAIRTRVEDGIDVFRSYAEAVRSRLAAVRDRLRDARDHIRGYVDIVLDRLADARDRVRTYANVVRERFNAIRDRLRDARDTLAGYAEAVGERLGEAGESLDEARDTLVGYANEAVSRLSEVRDMFTDAGDAASDYATDVTDAIDDAVESVSGLRNRLSVFTGASRAMLDIAVGNVEGYANDAADAIGGLSDDWDTHAADVRDAVKVDIGPTVSDYANDVSGLEAGLAITLGAASASWIGHSVDLSGAVSSMRGGISRLVTYLGTVSGPSQLARDAVARFGTSLLIVRRALRPIIKLLPRLAPALVRLTPAFAGAATAVALFAIAYEQNLFGVRDITDDVVGDIERTFDSLAAGIGDGIETALSGVREVWREHGEQIVRIIDTAMQIIDIIVDVGIGAAETTTMLALDSIARLWDTHAETLEQRVSGFLDAVEELFDGSLGFVLDVVEKSLNKQLGFWEDHDSDVESVLVAAGATWLGVVETGLDLILTFVESSLTVMTHAIRAAGLLWEGDWKGALNELERAAETVWSDIEGFFGRTLERINRVVARWAGTIVGDWFASLAQMVQDTIDWGADMVREAGAGMEAAKDEVIGEIDSLIETVGRKLGGLVDVWEAHFRNVKTAITGGIGDALGEYDLDDIEFDDVSVDLDFGSAWEDHGSDVSTTLTGPIANAVNKYNRWMRTLRETVRKMLTSMSDAWAGHVTTLQATAGRIKAEVERLRSRLPAIATQAINGVTASFDRGLSRLHTTVATWLASVKATVDSKFGAITRAVDGAGGDIESAIQGTLATVQQVWDATFASLTRVVSDWGRETGGEAGLAMDDIESAIQGTLATVQQVWDATFASLTRVVSDWAVSTITNASQAFDDTVREAGEFGRSLVDAITGGLGNALDAFIDWGISLIWGSIVPDIFDDIIMHVAGAMGDIQRAIVTGLNSIITKVASKLRGLIDVWKAHFREVEGIVERGIDDIEELFDGIDSDDVDLGSVTLDTDFGSGWDDHGTSVENTVNGPIQRAVNRYGRWMDTLRASVDSALAAMSGAWTDHSTTATDEANRLVPSLNDVRDAMKDVEIPSWAVHGAIAAVSLRFGLLKGVLPGVVTILGRLAPLLTGLNPILAGVATGVGLFAAAYETNFLGVRDITDDVVADVKGAVGPMAAFLINVTTDALNYLERLWEEHGPQVERIATKAYDLVKAIVGDLATFVINVTTDALRYAGDLWDAHGGRIKKIAERFWNALEDIQFIALEIFKGLWRWFVATVQDIIETGLPLVLDFVEGRLDEMAQFWEDHGDTIIGILEFFFSAATVAVDSGLDLVLTAFTIGFDLVTSVLEAAVQIWEGDYEGALNTMLRWTGRTIDNIQGFFERRFDAITRFLARWGSNLGGWFGGVMASMLKTADENLDASYLLWAGIFNAIYDKLAGWGDDIVGFFEGIFEWVVGGISDFGTDIKDGIKSGLDGALDAVIKWLSDLIGENDPRKTFDTIVSDIKVTLGKLGIDTEAILDGIFSIFTRWTDKLQGDVVDKAFEGIRTGVAEKLGATATTAGIGWEQVKGVSNTKLALLRRVVGGWWDSVKTKIGGVLDTIKETLPPKWQNFVNDIVGGAEDIYNDVTGELENLRGRGGDLFFFLKNRVEKYFGPMVEGIIDGAEDIYDDITNNFRDARDNAVNAAKVLKDKALEPIETLVEKVEGFAEDIEGAFDLAEEMRGHGENMMNGLRDGINNTKDDAIGAAEDAVDSVTGPIRNISSMSVENALDRGAFGEELEGFGDGVLVDGGGGAPGNAVAAAGGGLMASLAAGIRSNKHLPANETENAMGDVRDYLPSSNARVGPLTDIESVGPSFMQTLADGIRASADAVGRAVLQMVDFVRSELGHMETAADESISAVETTLHTGALTAVNAVGRAFVALVDGTRRQMAQMESGIGKSIDAIESDLESGALDAVNAVGRAFDDMRAGAARTFDQMETVLTRTFAQLAQTITRRAADLEHNVAQITATMRRRVAREFEQMRNSAMNATNTMAANVTARFRKMRAHLSSNATQMRNYVTARMNHMAAQARNAMSRFRNAVISGGNRAVTAARNTAIRMVNAVRSRIGSFQSAGAAMMNALRRGIRRRGSRAVAAARDVARRVRRTMPSSDAKEGPLSDLTTVGPGLVETFARGIESAADAPAAAAATMAANVKDVLSVTPDVAMAVDDGLPLQVTTGGRAGPTHQTIIHVGAIHASGRQEGREAASELKRLEREARRSGL